MDNPRIPAGFTYLGQFIDHDITFDPTSRLDQGTTRTRSSTSARPASSWTASTARVRLASPTSTTGKRSRGSSCSSGATRDPGADDLPRNRAGGADRRPPQRREPDRLAAPPGVPQVPQRGRRPPLAGRCARTSLRGGPADRALALPVDRRFTSSSRRSSAGTWRMRSRARDGAGRRRRFTASTSRWEHEPFIPVEFSAAAYRFGHSMVRADYGLKLPVGDDASSGPRLFPDLAGSASRASATSSTGTVLRAARARAAVQLQIDTAHRQAALDCPTGDEPLPRLNLCVDAGWDCRRARTSRARWTSGRSRRRSCCSTTCPTAPCGAAARDPALVLHPLRSGDGSTVNAAPGRLAPRTGRRPDRRRGDSRPARGRSELLPEQGADLEPEELDTGGDFEMADLMRSRRAPGPAASETDRFSDLLDRQLPRPRTCCRRDP